MASKPSSFKPIVLLQNQVLHQLQHTLDQQKQLTERIRAVLPEALAEHALHCLLKNNKLILYTDSANWASQLRFYNTNIVAAVAKANIILQIKVITLPNFTEIKNQKTVIPSQENIHFLKLYSNTVQHEPLKIALLKLIDNLTRLSSCDK